MSINKHHKFATKAIHAGIEPEPITGAIMTPIFQTSTYVQEGPGKHKGYEYARTQNPTRTVLQTQLAVLENGKHAICYGSGLAAIDAFCKTLRPGDEVLATSDLYGGTYRLFTKVFANYGIKFTFANLSDPNTISDKFTPNTKWVWLETPTNPMLQILDIEAICQIAKAKGAKIAVDNTFASPYLQNPLDLGADLIMHSITKYLGGHSDVVMGCLITSDDKLAEELFFIQNATGAVPGPQDCFLVLRGIKTLHIRMDRSCQNAMKIAHWLEAHPKVERVFYPGLTSHPNHQIAKKQMRNFGGMISFYLKGDVMEEATRVMENVRLFSLGESLGGVESLFTHPSGMTHASLPKEERLKNGLRDTLMRLSVGIEDADDLIADLENALSKA